MNPDKTCRGSALVAVMIFVAVFSALALGYLSVANANLKSARLYAQSQRALAVAESGLAVARAELPLLDLAEAPAGSSEALQTLADELNERWGATLFLGNAAVVSGNAVVLPPMILNAPSGPVSVQLTIRGIADDRYKVDCVGIYGDARKTVGGEFSIMVDNRLITRYGVASKSPIRMLGNGKVLGANESAEGSILSASQVTMDPIDITGHVEISGDVAITNPEGSVSSKGNVNIGGEIMIGVPEPPFPTIDTQAFEPYAVNIVDATTDTASDIVLENVRVLAGTNPVFSGHCTINGIMYIEAPNVVKFTGSADVTGIIVGEPPQDEGTLHGAIEFTGNLEVASVSQLPDCPEFEAIRDMTGSFLLAPGYEAIFNGSFSSISGAIVASKMAFGGDAAGTVIGSVVNLDDTDLTISGDATIVIDHSEDVELPYGLLFPRRMVFVGGSYTE
jgi:hypothetical protein